MCEKYQHLFALPQICVSTPLSSILANDTWLVLVSDVTQMHWPRDIQCDTSAAKSHPDELCAISRKCSDDTVLVSFSGVGNIYILCTLTHENFVFQT